MGWDWLRWRSRFLVVTVTGASMLPSLRPGDRLLVRRLPLSRMSVGQVAVLRAAGLPTSGEIRPSVLADAPGGYLIKRVAAVPGDRVPESCRAPTSPRLPEYVPPGSFIMLGDNPRRSYDSRFAGLIPADLLFGVAVRRLRTRAQDAGEFVPAGDAELGVNVLQVVIDGPDRQEEPLGDLPA
jgi:signal peptidase I